MKKLLLFLVILCSIVFGFPNSFNAWELPQDVMEAALFRQLRAPILSVVGTDWFRDNEKILEIKQDAEDVDKFYVTVQVVTFQGPHNPPYMQEIITFRFAGNEVKPIDYFNRVIPESEWHKFQLR
jgi:predicted RNA-binding Zn ribbon-like protein